MEFAPLSDMMQRLLPAIQGKDGGGGTDEDGRTCGNDAVEKDGVKGRPSSFPTS